MKTFRVIGMMTLTGAELLLLNACTGQGASFSNLPAVSNSASGTGGVICSPFQGGGTGGGGGILATVTYIPPQSPVINQGLDVESFDVGQPYVQVLPQQVFLNQFDIPTQNFIYGFSLPNGQPILTPDGQILDEYFSLQATGQIALNSSDGGVSQPGYYQFATLSDDGSVFTVVDSNNTSVEVNDDGTHSNKFACSPNAAYIDSTHPLNYQMKYYQGPPVRLGLIVFWRKVDPSNPQTLQDSECGTVGNDSYYFTDDQQNVPQPTANYEALLAHGWQVMPSANFVLPAGGNVNTCQ